eukprot:107648_1
MSSTRNCTVCSGHHFQICSDGNQLRISLPSEHHSQLFETVRTQLKPYCIYCRTHTSFWQDLVIYPSHAIIVLYSRALIKFNLPHGSALPEVLTDTCDACGVNAILGSQ